MKKKSSNNQENDCCVCSEQNWEEMVNVIISDSEEVSQNLLSDNQRMLEDSVIQRIPLK